MPRLVPAFQRGLSILCVTIALCASIAWLLSYKPPTADPIDFRLLGARYTLQSDRGYLRLLGPPGHPPSADRSVWRLVAQLRNDDISWTVRVPWTHIEPRFASTATVFGNAALANNIHRFGTAELTRPLLEALEDPNRYAVAHLWLTSRELTGYNASTRVAGDHLIAIHDGLEVSLRPALLRQDPKTLEAEFKKKLQSGEQLVEVCTGPTALQIAPDQLPKLRRQWHNKLDVRILSIPYAAIILLALAPPAMNLRRYWHSRRTAAARARGACPTCGYDLRASHERCPECGTPTL
jgi:hypothetical protein